MYLAAASWVLMLPKNNQRLHKISQVNLIIQLLLNPTPKTGWWKRNGIIFPSLAKHCFTETASLDRKMKIRKLPGATLERMVHLPKEQMGGLPKCLPGRSSDTKSAQGSRFPTVLVGILRSLCRHVTSLRTQCGRGMSLALWICLYWVSDGHTHVFHTTTLQRSSEAWRYGWLDFCSQRERWIEHHG